MAIPVSDRGANKNELIEHAAEVLGQSRHKILVLTHVYTGKSGRGCFGFSGLGH